MEQFLEGISFNGALPWRKCPIKALAKYLFICPEGNLSSMNYTVEPIISNSKKINNIFLQVIAREDKGSLGIDYNRSPIIYFQTETNSTIIESTAKKPTQTQEISLDEVPSHEILLLQQILMKMNLLEDLIMTQQSQNNKMNCT